MLAFSASFFSLAFSAFLFCRISLASFSSGSVVLVFSGFLTIHGLAVVLVFPSVFLHVKISVKLFRLYIKWSLGLKHVVLEGVM